MGSRSSDERERHVEPTQLHCTGACGRIGEQLGVNPEALRTWVKRAEIDEGLRPGTTTDDAAGRRIYVVPINNGSAGIAGGQRPATVLVGSYSSAKQRRRVETGEEPVHAAVSGDERPGLEVRKQRIILYGSSHGFTQPQLIQIA